MKRFKGLLVASTLAASLFTGTTFTEAAFPLEENVSFKYSNDTLWTIEGHGFDLAHKYGYTGEGVKIGVIDSGFINKSFTKLKTNFDSNESFTSDYAVMTGKKENAALYHGTTVLSTLKAVLPDAEYNFYSTEKVMNYNIKALMQQAINDNVDIITMSLSERILPEEKVKAMQKFNNEFASIIAQAKQKNIAIVISSGNKSTKEINYYTLNDYIISVGAVDNTLNLSSFSTYFEKGDIKFVGAGERLSIDDPIENGKKYIQGTSYSAPTIAAMFGILKQIYPHATVTELVGIMESISYDLGEFGLDAKYGNGFPTFKNYNFEEKRTFTAEEKAQEKEFAQLEELKKKVDQNKFNLFISYKNTNEVKHSEKNNSYTVELGEEYKTYRNAIVNVKDLQTERYINTDIKYNDKEQSVTFTFKNSLEVNNSYAIAFHSQYAEGHLTILDIVE